MKFLFFELCQNGKSDLLTDKDCLSWEDPPKSSFLGVEYLIYGWGCPIATLLDGGGYRVEALSDRQGYPEKLVWYIVGYPINASVTVWDTL